MTNKERSDLAQWAVDHTIKSGADQAAVTLSNTREVEIEYRDKKLEKLQEAKKVSLSLDIYKQNRYSSHTTNDIRKDSLQKFIEQAVSATGYLTEDKFRSLPDPRYYPAAHKLDLKLRDPDYDGIESSQRIKLASQIEEAAMAQSDKIISTTSGYKDSFYETVKVHSNGLTVESRGTSFSAGAMVTVKGDGNSRPEDWYWAKTRFQKELPTPEILGKKAAERALRKIGQKKIDTGKYNMIIENRAVEKFIYWLIRPMQAGTLQQKNSYLENMLNKKIASEKLTMIDDPMVEKGLGSRFFDGEGLGARKRVMIEKGILRSYYVDNYYGRKIAMEPTSGSTSNLVFELGPNSLEQMVRNLKKGIVVTGFIGGNCNSTTGDFSVGIFGLLVESGQVTQPVCEMNISGNAKDFWLQLVETGSDPYPYSSWQRPSLMFENINFSGL